MKNYSITSNRGIYLTILVISGFLLFFLLLNFLLSLYKGLPSPSGIWEVFILIVTMSLISIFLTSNKKLSLTNSSLVHRDAYSNVTDIDYKDITRYEFRLGRLEGSNKQGMQLLVFKSPSGQLLIPLSLFKTNDIFSFVEKLNQKVPHADYNELVSLIIKGDTKQIATDIESVRYANAGDGPV